MNLVTGLSPEEELKQKEAELEALESSRNFKPSDSLKKLYREVTKRIHPDLVTDEEV